MGLNHSSPEKLSETAGDFRFSRCSRSHSFVSENPNFMKSKAINLSKFTKCKIKLISAALTGDFLLLRRRLISYINNFSDHKISLDACENCHFSKKKRKKEKFISYRCFLDCFDENHRTLTYLCASKDFHQCLHFLIALGADLSIPDDCGVSPLYVAACRGNIRCMELLIDHNAPMNVSNSSGWLLLHRCIRSGRADCLKVLLGGRVSRAVNSEDICCDIEAEDAAGFKAIHYAAGKYANLDCLEQLIAKGCQLNSKNGKGYTALHSAAGKYNNVSIVNLLLEKGADPWLESLEGALPLHMAIQYGNTHCFIALLRVMENQGREYCENSPNSLIHSPFWFSSTFPKTSARKYFHPQFSLSVDSEFLSPKEGHTLLVHAISYGAVEILKILLELGANPNVLFKRKIDSKNLRSALSHACSMGYHEIIQQLLQAGADPNLWIGPNMISPLEATALASRKIEQSRAYESDLSEDNILECIKILLDYGASIPSNTKHGCQLSGIAEKNGCQRVARFFATVENQHRSLLCLQKLSRNQLILLYGRGVASMGGSWEGTDVSARAPQHILEILSG